MSYGRYVLTEYKQRSQSVPLNGGIWRDKAAQKCTGPVRLLHCRVMAWRGWKDVYSGTLCQNQTVCYD